jgi:hypothetical protein
VSKPSAEKREVKPERIVYLRETIRMTLDGEIADNNDNRGAVPGVAPHLDCDDDPLNDAGMASSGERSAGIVLRPDQA